jgi:hypothetical protein
MAGMTLICLLGLRFFGLTSDSASQFRLNLFSIIHEIIFHGKGGYDYDTVYNMPIWLRMFTFNKINEFYKPKDDSDDIIQQTKSNIIKSQTNTISPPVFKPDYVSKASRK